MRNIFVATLFSSATLIGCQNARTQTENGTVINYFEKGEGSVPIDTLISLFNIRYTTENGYVILESDAENLRPIKIDPNAAAGQGELFEVLKLLKVGDSVGFEITAGDLYETTFKQPLPDTIAADSKIQFQIAFKEQLTEDGYYKMVEEKAEKAAVAQLAIDGEIIDDYLFNNKIEAITTESGLRYVVTEEGDGQKPTVGATVQVNYAGRILEGEYFDTSIEKVAKENGLYQEGRPYEPFKFLLGQGQVIRGWDEGIALLNVGTKATFYIPSSLGYGSRKAGELIQPNSILIFDVELIDFE